MKIEVVIDQAYNSFLNQKLNLDYWHENYELKIINLGKIFYDDLNISESCPFNQFYFEDKKTLNNHIKNSCSDVTLVFLRYPISEILNLLIINKRKIYIVLMNYLPTTILGNKLKRLLIKINTNLSIFGFKKLFHKIKMKNLLMKNKIHGLYLMGGDDGKNQFKHLIGKKTKIIQSYCYNAEELKKGKKKNINKYGEKIAIFIDQAFPIHPDILELGLIIDKNFYYKRLNEFFSYLEDKYGYRVIIMGHPRVTYKKNPFYSREILYGRTEEYSRIAETIITFSSTAISFGIMLKKNILLLATNKLLRSHHDILSFQSYLGCQVINLSKKEFPEIKNKIDYAKYNEYERLFIGDYKNIDTIWSPLIEEITNLSKNDKKN